MEITVRRLCSLRRGDKRLILIRISPSLALTCQETGGTVAGLLKSVLAFLILEVALRVQQVSISAWG